MRYIIATILLLSMPMQAHAFIGAAVVGFVVEAMQENDGGASDDD